MKSSFAIMVNEDFFVIGLNSENIIVKMSTDVIQIVII